MTQPQAQQTEILPEHLEEEVKAIEVQGIVASLAKLAHGYARLVEKGAEVSEKELNEGIYLIGATVNVYRMIDNTMFDQTVLQTLLLISHKLQEAKKRPKNETQVLT